MQLKLIGFEELRDRMKVGIVCFAYRKADASERVAYGTLDLDTIRDNGATPRNIKDVSGDVITYFDLERSAWRSFRRTSFLGVDEDYGY